MADPVISVLQYHASQRICRIPMEVQKAIGKGISSSSFTCVWKIQDPQFFSFSTESFPLQVLLPFLFLSFSISQRKELHFMTMEDVTYQIQTLMPWSILIALMSFLDPRLLHPTYTSRCACLKLSSVSFPQAHMTFCMRSLIHSLLQVVLGFQTLYYTKPHK